MSVEWLFVVGREAVQKFIWKKKRKTIEYIIMIELTIQNRNFRYKVYLPICKR
jgi:hypothetical protein